MRRMRRGAKLIYGSGEIMNGTSSVIVVMLFLKFLTDVVGLEPIWAGVCLVAGKLWDALSDPLLGSISDRTESRLGRRRFYFIAFCAPASLAFVAMWIHLDTELVWARVLYYSLAYTAFKTMTTAINVPYQALGPELTDDYDQRTSLVAYRMAFSLGGAILAGVVPALLLERFARLGLESHGHWVVAAIFGAVYLAVWLLIFFRIEERPSVRGEERPRLLRALLLTLGGRQFRILIGMYLAGFLALDILTAAAKFYVDEYLRRPALMPLVMGSLLGTAMICLPLYRKVIARFERRIAFAAGMAVWLLGLGGLWFVGPSTHPILLALAMAVIGAGVCATFVVPWSALPEIIDLDRFAHGRSQEGIFNGVMTFLRKVATTGALFALSLTLEGAGYRPPVEGEDFVQGERTLLAVRLMTVAAPALVVVLGLLIGTRYGIDRDACALLRRSEGDGEPLNDEEKERLRALL